MSKRPNPKKAAEASLGGASKVLLIGLVAEIYLLIVQRYYVNGTVSQVVSAAYALEYLFYFGIVLLGAGIAMLVLHRRKKGFAAWGFYLTLAGVFLCAGNRLMLAVYPGGSTALNVIVPVAVVIGIVYFLYQREFFFGLLSLTLTMAALVCCNKGIANANWHTRVLVLSLVVLVLVAALLAFALACKRNDGILTVRGKVLRVFPKGSNYTLMLAVCVLCAVLILLALFAGIAYYTVWAGGIAIFALAVYYTIKLL